MQSTATTDMDALRLKAAADYDASPQLRAEFPTKECYVALCVAEARGQVRTMAPMRKDRQ